MNDFFQRMQWKLMSWMQGRYGNDNLSSFLMGAAIVLMLVSFVFGFDIVWTLSSVLLILVLFRTFSKNITARAKENSTFERVMIKPKHQWDLLNKRWINRKTTQYFKCKNCGQMLSVPRGKGTLRVVCPKCKTETVRKS